MCRGDECAMASRRLDAPNRQARFAVRLVSLDDGCQPHLLLDNGVGLDEFIRDI